MPRRSSGSVRGTYGSLKIFIELIRAGWRVSVNTVARLGLAARTLRRWSARPGLTGFGSRPTAPDLLRRDFSAPAPDTVWAGDTNEIGTDEGKLYLAAVTDLYSRRLLGFAMSAHHDAELVVAALNLAVACCGDVSSEIFHSDRGSEHASKRLGDACRRWGVWQSMGRWARVPTTPSQRRSTVSGSTAAPAHR